MTYDANSDLQCYHLQQQRDVAEKRAHQLGAPKIEMVIGSWQLDEFGNQTREIRARE